MTVEFTNRADGSVHYTRKMSENVPIWYLNMIANKLKLDLVIVAFG